MNESKWDAGMTDLKFVQASMPFFEHQTWTLHDGICLFCKINPIQKTPSVGVLPEDGECPTKRIYKISLKAINNFKKESSGIDRVKPLEPLKDNPFASDATGVLVDPRDFVEWTIKNWPDQSSHMRKAEEQYKLRKDAKKDQDKILGKKSFGTKVERNRLLNGKRQEKHFFKW